MAALHKDQRVIESAKSHANIQWCDDFEKMISGVLLVDSPDLLPHWLMALSESHQV
jgi:hypothetical protein